MGEEYRKEVEPVIQRFRERLKELSDQLEEESRNISKTLENFQENLDKDPRYSNTAPFPIYYYCDRRCHYLEQTYPGIPKWHESYENVSIEVCKDEYDEYYATIKVGSLPEYKLRGRFLYVSHGLGHFITELHKFSTMMIKPLEK